VSALHTPRFPAVSLFTIGEVFGSWQQAHSVHFRDGGVFDQLSQANR
jgi:ABC-type sulfate transport system substrate-binding protein